MNPNRRAVVLDAQWVERSRAFGHEMVRYYAEEGANSPSHSVSGDRGAERDPVRQGIGKVGECALAMLFRQDPGTVVKWSVGRADSGHDLLCNFGRRIDVKSTESWKRFLVWSRDINDLYDSKEFDYLVAVSVDEDDWSRCWIEGCVSKRWFRRHRLVADGDLIGRGLEAGTRHMAKADLDPIADLLRAPEGFVGYDSDGHFVHYCHCGKWGFFGEDVAVLKGKVGKWFCQEHRPASVPS